MFWVLKSTVSMGAKKNRLIETVLLSTHNIYFGLEIRKLNFRYALLTKVLDRLHCLAHAKDSLVQFTYTIDS